MRADWLHNPCRLGGLQHFRAGSGKQVCGRGAAPQRRGNGGTPDPGYPRPPPPQLSKVPSKPNLVWLNGASNWCSTGEAVTRIRLNPPPPSLPAKGGRIFSHGSPPRKLV